MTVTGAEDVPMEPEAVISTSVAIVPAPGAEIPAPLVSRLPVDATPDVALRKNVPVGLTVDGLMVIVLPVL